MRVNPISRAPVAERPRFSLAAPALRERRRSSLAALSLRERPLSSPPPPLLSPNARGKGEGSQNGRDDQSRPEREPILLPSFPPSIGGKEGANEPTATHAGEDRGRSQESSARSQESSARSNKHALVSVLAASLSLSACAHAPLPPGFHPNKDGSVARAFADGSTESVGWKSGAVDPGTVVDGVPCEGEVAIWKTGRLWYCFASRDFTARGVAFKGGDTVDFLPDGRPQSGRLAADHAFGTWSCKAGGAFRFYDHGEFAGCDAPGELVLDGVACASGKPFTVFESGALHACAAARDEDVKGIPCKEETPIELAKNGALVRATLGEAVTFGGVTWPEGVTLEFYDTGMLRRGELRERAFIQGRAFAAGEHPCFDADGRLYSDQKRCGGE